MRLAIFAPTPSGGHPEYVAKLVGALHEARPEWEVTWPVRLDFSEANSVASVSQPAVIPIMPDRQAVSTILWLIARLRPGLRHDSAFIKFVKQSRPPITHVLIEEHQRLRSFWLVNQLQSAGATVVFHLHNTRRHDYQGTALDRMDELDLGRALRASEAVVVHTRHALTLVRERYGRQGQTDVVPHGLSPKSSQPTEPPTRLTILFFGVNRPNKGLHVLVEALQLLNSKTDYLLVVAGVTPLEQTEPTKHLLASLPASRVTWLPGHQSADQTARLFEMATLVALPYTSFEAQSGVLHLALEFGLPVVASRLSGIEEAVSEGDFGLLVPPCDSARLAEAISRCAESNANRRFRANAVSYASQRSWRHSANVLANSIDHLPGARARRITEPKTVGGTT